jgi:ABC-type multidrug transport system ATPase subunit
LDCADTKVGGHLKKGISGGERKRAAIGVELVVEPNLLFLDEPTNGLDSFSAVRLCQVLKKVANAGATFCLPSISLLLRSLPFLTD